MSSILKALRKIEEEKRTASHAAPDLRMEQGNSSRKSWPFLPLATGIVLGAACVGVFSFWSSSKDPDAALPVLQPVVAGVAGRQTAASVIETEEKLFAAPAKPPVAPVEESVAAAVAEIEVREVILPEENVVVVSDQAPMQEKQATPLSESKPSPDAVVSEIETKPAEEQPQVESIAAELSQAESVAVNHKALPVGTHLEVSEIFYQDDPANSMAVVNDLPVMIGTFVNSAMVLEIYPGKVVFKIDDSTYDVSVTPLP